MADRSDIDEQTAATLTTVLTRRRELRNTGRARAVLDRARVSATLSERAGGAERRYRALVDEAAAAIAEAERVPGAPFR